MYSAITLTKTFFSAHLPASSIDHDRVLGGDYAGRNVPVLVVGCKAVSECVRVTEMDRLMDFYVD